MSLLRANRVLVNKVIDVQVGSSSSSIYKVLKIPKDLSEIEKAHEIEQLLGDLLYKSVMKRLLETRRFLFVLEIPDKKLTPENPLV